MGGGVTDDDYRGAVSIIFFNYSSQYVQREEGERFCQILFQKIAHSTNLVEAEDIGSTQQEIGALVAQALVNYVFYKKKKKKKKE